MLDDRQIDALVAERVMGWRHDDYGRWWHKDWAPACNCTGFAQIPRYSTDIYAAWLVVAAMKENWTFILHDAGSQVYCDGCKTFDIPTAIFDKKQRNEDDYESPLYNGRFLRSEVSDKSVTRAICFAALKAVGVEVEKTNA